MKRHEVKMEEALLKLNTKIDKIDSALKSEIKQGR
jgi:hypothetical protein